MAGQVADADVLVRADHEPDQGPDRPDLPHCELVLNLLARKWVIPILVELAAEPRRRQYLFHRLKVSSSRLDPTIRQLTRLGLVERTFIPHGQSDGPGLAITELGRSFLVVTATLGEWEDVHRSELLINIARWRELHPDGPV